jgi:hypothetical protein
MNNSVTGRGHKDETPTICPSGTDCAVSSWFKNGPRWGAVIVLKCEMENSHVKSLVGNRERKWFRSQRR